MDVFRRNMPKMTELLRTSVVNFPGLLSKHGIKLDDATTYLAISPIPDTDVTVKVFTLVKEKVKDEPEEVFEKFIQCLEDVDDFYFENIIKKLGQCMIDNVFQRVHACVVNILNLLLWTNSTKMIPLVSTKLIVTFNVIKNSSYLSSLKDKCVCALSVYYIALLESPSKAFLNANICRIMDKFP